MDSRLQPLGHQSSDETWQARLYFNGLRIWECQHAHGSLEEGWQCAEDEADVRSTSSANPGDGTPGLAIPRGTLQTVPRREPPKAKASRTWSFSVVEGFGFTKSELSTTPR